MRARDYTPATGRFRSTDPLTNPVDEPAVSPYTYAHNNPLTRTDPSGLCDWYDVVCGAKAIGNWAKGEVQEDMGDVARAAHGLPPAPRTDIGNDGKYTFGDFVSDGSDCDRPGATVMNPACRYVNEVIAPGADLVADLSGFNEGTACLQGDLKACAWIAGAAIVGMGIGAGLRLAGNVFKWMWKVAKRGDDLPKTPPRKPGTPTNPKRESPTTPTQSPPPTRAPTGASTPTGGGAGPHAPGPRTTPTRPGGGPSVFRAPQSGQGPSELANGLNPANHVGGDRSAYVGTETVARDKFAGFPGYEPGYVRYDMQPVFETEFASYRFPYEGGQEFEWQIPYEQIGRFNELTLNRTWIPWRRQ